MPFATLPDRGLLEISGEDRVSFLQGLVSNDVALAAPDRQVWAALLTPQGKWLADFFLRATPDTLLLEGEAAQLPMLAQRLGRFRLRAKVALRVLEGLHVVAGWDGSPPPPGALADPRLAEAGWRAVLPAPAGGDPAAYDRHRLALGLPDGSRDLEPEKTVLLEAGFDELNGIGWTKGCYMGQELTARTRYRGLLKRRLVPLAFEGEAPPRGTAITRDGIEMGEMRSGQAGLGLAVLRLEALAPGAALRAGDLPVAVKIPAWMRLPAATSAA
jgi:folate-binding protein YgfZ